MNVNSRHPDARLWTPREPHRGRICAVLVGALAAIPAQADSLSFVTGMAEGSWAKLNLNSISSVWTPPSDRFTNPSFFPNNQAAIINAWSSFAWDSGRGNLIIYGGGHANYVGNDVYMWNGSTLLWERASLPSQVVKTAVGGGYDYFFPVDGSLNAPASAHTYDNTVYLKQSDRYLTFGGAAAGSGASYLKSSGPGFSGPYSQTGPYLFDPTRADPFKVGGTTGSGVDPTRIGGEMWQNRDSFVANPNAPDQFIAGLADATVENGKDVVYVAARKGGGTAQALWRYTIHDLADPSQDTWEQVGAFPNSNPIVGDGGGAFDSKSNIFLRTGDASHWFAYWDLDNPSASNPDIVVAPTDLTGGAAPRNLYGFGLDNDPQRHRFLFWGGGTDVWALNQPEGAGASEWTVTRESPQGVSGPGPVNTVGIQGKWHYASDLDAFIALQSPQDGDVWVYKPLGWINPVPEPSTWAMVLCGFGIVAFTVGRHRRAHKEVASRPPG